MPLGIITWSTLSLPPLMALLALVLIVCHQ